MDFEDNWQIVSKATKPSKQSLTRKDENRQYLFRPELAGKVILAKKAGNFTMGIIAFSGIYGVIDRGELIPGSGQNDDAAVNLLVRSKDLQRTVIPDLRTGRVYSIAAARNLFSAPRRDLPVRP